MSGRRAVEAACRSWGVELVEWLDADDSAVAAVRLADGSHAVAKLPPPGIDHRNEGDALAAWWGRGAVHLLDRNAGGVLLLERAMPGGTAVADATVATATARLWIDPPAGVAWRRFDEALVGWLASIERWHAELGEDVVSTTASRRTGASVHSSSRGRLLAEQRATVARL